MKILAILLISQISFSQNSFSNTKRMVFPVDKKDQLGEMLLKTGKLESNRHFSVDFKKVLNKPIDSVLKALRSAEQRCNNSFKQSRKYSSRNYPCKYHSKNVVEAVKHAIIIPGYSKDDFVQTKFIKKRGDQIVHELYKFKKKTVQGKKHYSLWTETLDDDTTKKLTGKDLKLQTAIKISNSEFILKEITPNKTEVTFMYEMATDHWLVNKKIVAGKVFSDLRESILALFSKVEEQAAIL